MTAISSVLYSKRLKLVVGRRSPQEERQQAGGLEQAGGREARRQSPVSSLGKRLAFPSYAKWDSKCSALGAQSCPELELGRNGAVFV